MFFSLSAVPVSTSLVTVPDGVDTASATYPLHNYVSVHFASFYTTTLSPDTSKERKVKIGSLTASDSWSFHLSVLPFHSHKRYM